MGEVALISVVVLWAAAVLETIRVARGAGSRPLAVAVASLAIGRTLDLDEVGEALGRTAYLSVIEHTATLVSALGVLAFTGAITSAGHGRASRVQQAATDLRLWIVLAAAVAVPLIDATEILPATAAERAAVYASDPLWVIHWAAFLAVVAVVLWHGAGIALRNARHATGVLRARLIGIGLGQTLGVFYAALKGVHLPILATAPEVDTAAISLAEQGALVLCILGIATGLAVGALDTALANLRTRHQIWTLWPLWRDLWDHAPHLSYGRAPSRLRATFAPDPELIVVRQAVELGDAARNLGPQMPHHDPADPESRARALAVAAARHAAGLPALQRSGDGGPPSTRVEALLPVARRWRTAAAQRLSGELRPVS